MTIIRVPTREERKRVSGAEFRRRPAQTDKLRPFLER
jgi:hypothetical protein